MKKTVILLVTLILCVGECMAKKRIVEIRPSYFPGYELVRQKKTISDVYEFDYMNRKDEVRIETKISQSGITVIFNNMNEKTNVSIKWSSAKINYKKASANWNIKEIPEDDIIVGFGSSIIQLYHWDYMQLFDPKYIDKYYNGKSSTNLTFIYEIDGEPKKVDLNWDIIILKK